MCKVQWNLLRLLVVRQRRNLGGTAKLFRPRLLRYKQSVKGLSLFFLASLLENFFRFFTHGEFEKEEQKHEHRYCDDGGEAVLTAN